MTPQDGYHDLPRGKLAMVVTYLEMTSRAQLRDVPCPDGLQFADLPRDPDVYRDVFRRVGQDWLWYGRLTLGDLELCAIIEHPNVDLWTLLKDGRPEALLELDFREPGQCEIQYFGLSPSLIGCGAGAFLMDRAIDLAWQRQITRLHLHTCTLDSPQALDFYIRSGFTPCARKIEIADDPRQTGIYPENAAPQIPLL